VARYVALLRGINVGRGNRLAMADLRTLLEELGFSDVRTLLNSGNAVFTAAGRTAASRHAADIRKVMVAKLGLDVLTIVKRQSEIDSAIDENPIAEGERDPARLLVAFAEDRGSLAALDAIRPLVRPPERFELGGHAAYLYMPSGLLQSKAGDALLGKLGRRCTTRNWSTLQKIAVALRSGSD
jgi:uncharacterized protein (DUF1697 family)